MQPRRSLIYILAALITLPLFGSVASAATIDILQTFDYPGSGVTATLPQKISDQTDLVGTLITADGTARAFIYKPLSRKFSPLLIPPFANKASTQGRGIDFRRHVVGEYLNAKRWHLSRLFDDPPQLYTNPNANANPNTFFDPNRDSYAHGNCNGECRRVILWERSRSATALPSRVFSIRPQRRLGYDPIGN